MKYFLLLILILAGLIGYGQVSQRQLDEWDSLGMRTDAELRKYDEVFLKEVCYSDTAKAANTLTITYYSSNRKKLRTVSNYYNPNNCISGITTEYFNKDGLVEYYSTYKKCCEQKLADDEICFEYVPSYGRYQYDKQGRVVLHVYHISTPMTFKVSYTYSEDGNRQVKREHIHEPHFLGLTTPAANNLSSGHNGSIPLTGFHFSVEPYIFIPATDLGLPLLAETPMSVRRNSYTQFIILQYLKKLWLLFVKKAL